MTLNMIMRTRSARCSLLSSIFALRTCTELVEKCGEVGGAQCPAVEVAESCDAIDCGEPLFDLVILRDRRIKVVCHRPDSALPVICSHGGLHTSPSAATRSALPIHDWLTSNKNAKVGYSSNYTGNQ
jgi:hypothetical protein